MTGEMEAYRVTVDPRLSCSTDPGRDYRGQCYKKAWEYLEGRYTVEPALRLVHGTLHIKGRPVAHAWVELPGVWVFDPVDQDFFDRNAYYRVLHGEAERVYTYTEARQLAMTTEHYGPWHETTHGSHVVGTADGQL
jgi:hypothetical protein